MFVVSAGFVHSEENSVTSILNPDNRLFALARQGKGQPSALAAIAVVLVILALVLVPGQILARLVVRLIFPGGIQSIATPMVQNIFGFLPAYLGLWVWLRLSSKRPFRSLGFETPGALGRILGGALAAGLMIAVTAGLATIPGASVEPGTQASILAALGIGLLSLLSYAVQSSAEEALFRGWLLPVIGSRYRPWIGVLVSTLLFSLAHALNPGITPAGIVESPSLWSLRGRLCPGGGWPMGGMRVARSFGIGQ